MTQDDRDLRDLFAALRREDARTTPPFQALWNATTPRPTRMPWIAAMAASAALAILVLVFQRGSETTVALSEWKAPTDFLLETPGRDLLTTVPRFGIKEPLP